MIYENGQRQTIHFDPYSFHSNYNLEDLKSRYNMADRTIEDALQLIENINCYKKELMDHVQKVLNTQFKNVLHFERWTTYKERVKYSVKIKRIPIGVEDFKDDLYIYQKEYEGRERHEAIKDVKRLIKEYNGIEVIERGIKIFT